MKNEKKFKVIRKLEDGPSELACSVTLGLQSAVDYLNVKVRMLVGQLIGEMRTVTITPKYDFEVVWEVTSLPTEYVVKTENLTYFFYLVEVEED